MKEKDILTIALRLAIMRLNDEFSHIKSVGDLIKESDRYVEEAENLVMALAPVVEDKTFVRDLNLCDTCHGYGICQDWCMPD